MYILSNVISLLFISIVGADEGSPCTTPNGEKATCVTIHSCKVISDALKYREASAVEFARKSLCGFNGKDPMVCCGSAGRPTTTESPTRRPTLPTGDSAEPCITPSGEQGECVSIDDCPALTNAFANPINGTEEILNKFWCGSYNSDVCCISAWNSTNYGKGLPDRRYCGYQHTDDYFYTGNTTSIDEFPWLAALVGTHPRTGEDEILCHGSLINNRYILTSANCINITIYGVVSKVLLGKYLTKNATSCIDHEEYGQECAEVQEFGIEEIIVHPFYTKILYPPVLWDIALIRLNKTTSYTDYIRPICLPTQGTKFAEVDDILYTTGWGGKNHYVPALIKKKVKTILLTPEECQKGHTRATSTYHICTLNLEDDTEFSCQYDVGTPIMYSYRNQWQIEGIVALGSLCGAKKPEFHTRVSPYIDWITQNIRS